MHRSALHGLMTCIDLSGFTGDILDTIKVLELIFQYTQICINQRFICGSIFIPEKFQEYENETFSFMYFVTDNTFRYVQKAFYIVAAQPTTAALGDLYNHDKSDISFKEVSLNHR